MNDITVHQATIFDLESLVPLFDGYRQFYGSDSDAFAAREFLRDRLNYGESVIFLAQQNRQSMGFVQLYPSFSSVSLTRIFWMNDLYVDEQARRKGVALKLMTAAVDYACAVGAEKISLAIGVTNKLGQELYGSTGWELDEQFLSYHFVVPQQVQVQG